MHEISIIKLNKADKPYQILLLKDDDSVQIFKIQLDRNLVLDKNMTKFESIDELETIVKEKLDIKGTLPNEIKSWCHQNEVLRKTLDIKPGQDEVEENS
ncbi:MAG: hypothetical protein JSV49_01765 [Thermoplasmata archaeon]|nr:MAG: hypothetical protein JSV49_01765 [Thermoplasmata archaeon]